jgi:hypothetical protein
MLGTKEGEIQSQPQKNGHKYKEINGKIHIVLTPNENLCSVLETKFK